MSFVVTNCPHLESEWLNLSHSAMHVLLAPHSNILAFWNSKKCLYTLFATTYLFIIEINTSGHACHRYFAKISYSPPLCILYIHPALIMVYLLSESLY